VGSVTPFRGSTVLQYIAKPSSGFSNTFDLIEAGNGSHFRASLELTIETESGFPAGMLADTARAGRFLVPVGENGLATYLLERNGTAKLKNVLIAR
jgi:hypothetical protein